MRACVRFCLGSVGSAGGGGTEPRRMQGPDRLNKGGGVCPDGVDKALSDWSGRGGVRRREGRQGVVGGLSMQAQRGATPSSKLPLRVGARRGRC